MSEPKRLTPEELSAALKNVTAADQPRAHWRDALQGHIAALEADKDEWKRKAMDAENHPAVQAFRRERDEAVADNAALLGALGDAVPQAGDFFREKYGLDKVLAEPHPGAALLAQHDKEIAHWREKYEACCEHVKQTGAEHRKALIRARNEGLERAAKRISERASELARIRNDTSDCCVCELVDEVNEVRAMKRLE